MGDRYKDNDAAHDDVDDFRRRLDHGQLRSAVLHGAVEDAREDAADGAGASDQGHRNTFKAEAFLGCQLGKSAAHAQDLDRSADAGQGAGDGQGRQDGGIGVDAGVLGRVPVEAYGLETEAQGSLVALSPKMMSFMRARVMATFMRRRSERKPI